MRSIMIEEQHSPGALCARFVLLMIMTLAPAGFASADEIGDLKAGVVKITAKVDGKTRVGTGIIVRLESDAVHIVTASHVIEGDPHPNVSFFTRPNRPLDAKVVGMEGGDPRGLAALLVEGEIPSGLRALWIDPTAELSGGEPVTLIGFPRRLGTAWAITIGSISGLRGRDITFQAPADEGNSGGPLIMHGKVVGVVTESRGQFGFAVPTPIVRVALSSWGVRLALEGGGAASPERSASTTDAAALGGAGGGQGRASDISASSGSVTLTGTWKHVANPLLSYVFEQEGRTVNMVEITTACSDRRSRLKGKASSRVER